MILSVDLVSTLDFPLHSTELDNTEKAAIFTRYFWTCHQQ
jgi:hypothetical protein